MLNQYLLLNVAYHNYHLPYNTKTCITMWNLETTAKGIFLCQPIKTTRKFSAIAVGYIYVTNIQFRKNRMIEDKIIFFFGSGFYIKKTFQ